MDLLNKSDAVLVTGGASGIGLAVVRELLAQGRAVAVADANASALQALPALVEPHSGRLCALQCDIADEVAVAQMFASAVRQLGRISGLVQSAGVGFEKAFVDTPSADFERVLRVNLLGSFLVGQVAARHMLAAGGGAIVNIASASGLTGNAGRAAYGASKAGVVAMTKVMAVELAAGGVRVNALAPGAIETPLVAAMHSPQTRAGLLARIPQRRYGTPQEVARMAVMLLDERLSGYCTGQVIAVDGGMTSAGLMAAGAAADR